jgi:hypothetical protein
VPLGLAEHEVAGPHRVELDLRQPERAGELDGLRRQGRRLRVRSSCTIAHARCARTRARSGSSGAGQERPLRELEQGRVHLGGPHPLHDHGRGGQQAASPSAAARSAVRRQASTAPSTSPRV